MRAPKALRAIRYRPGPGAGALAGTTAAVLLVMAVLASFLLFPGDGCNANGCGRAGAPEVSERVPDPLELPSAEPSAGTPSGTPADRPTDGPSGGGEAVPGPVGTEAPGDSTFSFDATIEVVGRPGGRAVEIGEVGAVIMPGKFTLVRQNAGRGYLKVVPAARNATGRLDPLLVQDFRGSRDGWTLTATMTDFTGPGGAVLAADNLNWQPSCRDHPDGGPYPSKAVSGTATKNSRSALLCSSAASPDVTGGQFDVEAGLDFPVPLGTLPGEYSANLLLTLA